MRLEILASLSLLGLTLAAPSALSADKRDKFDKCSKFGANCAVQDQSFCDASTGKISVCHKFGSDCWIRYTQDPCSAKREAEPEVEMEKRDKFDKCSVFGANCATDGNEFCDASTGKLSICHQVPFSSECWVRYTQTPCASKREAEVEAKVETKREVEVEKRDRFDKCSVFGANCAVDGNEFCLDGRKSVCHKVPWSNECWVRFMATSC